MEAILNEDEFWDCLENWISENTIIILDVKEPPSIYGIREEDREYIRLIQILSINFKCNYANLSLKKEGLNQTLKSWSKINK
jgi:hypothetical protein